MKNEKGSITLFVLIALIVVLIILSGLYISLRNQKNAQEKESEEIVNSYQRDINKIDKIYENKVNEVQDNGGI